MSKKVALVHDYLRDYGGAERVLEALHELYPDAPVYVSFIDRDKLGMHAKRFESWDIRESWLTKIPLYKKLFSPLRIWAPRYFSAFDLSEYDLVISSSNAYFAKAVSVDPDKHICYCHTPPRALWGYATQTNWRSNLLLRVIGSVINHYLRVIDVEVSTKLRHILVNSAETSRRVKHFYKKDSSIVYPPVDTKTGLEKVKKLTKKQLQSKKDGYYLFVSRLAFAKHPQLAIKVCNELKLPLKVAGEGALLEELRALAGPTVEVLGGVSDQQLSELYLGARALLYPVEDEDFGIVPVEALSFGTPVITHASGGPLETVTPQVGVHFQSLNVAGLKAAIAEFESRKNSFKAEALSEYAQQFSVAAFNTKMQLYIDTHISAE